MRTILRFISTLLLLLCLTIGIVSLARAADDPAGKDAARAIVPQGSQWAEKPGGNNVPESQDFPDRSWWRKFNDPLLDGYEADAVRNNPDLLAAIQRLEASRAGVSQAISSQLPTLNVSPSYTRVKLPSDILSGPGSSAFPNVIKIFQLPFRAAFEVDLFGKYRDQTKAARKALEATSLDARAVQIALEGEVASNYINLLRADALVDTQTRNLALLTRIHDLQTSRNAIGLTTYDEAIRADRDVAQAQTLLTNYRQQQSLYAHALTMLTGHAPTSADTLTRGTLDQLTMPTETDTGTPTDLLTRRPDILAQERRLAQANINVRVARKAFLPTLNLSGMFALASGNFGELFNWNNRLNMETVSLGQPLYQGGRLRAGVRLNRANAGEQVQNYRKTILVAVREVEDNLALLRADYDNLASNAHRLELTRQDLRLTENRVRQGLEPKLDSYQAQTELVQYQQIDLQSRADAAVALVNLYKALGGGF